MCGAQPSAGYIGTNLLVLNHERVVVMEHFAFSGEKQKCYGPKVLLLQQSHHGPKSNLHKREQSPRTCEMWDTLVEFHRGREDIHLKHGLRQAGWDES